MGIMYDVYKSGDYNTYNSVRQSDGITHVITLGKRGLNLRYRITLRYKDTSEEELVSEEAFSIARLVENKGKPNQRILKQEVKWPV